MKISDIYLDFLIEDRVDMFDIRDWSRFWRSHIFTFTFISNFLRGVHKALPPPLSMLQQGSYIVQRGVSSVNV